MSKGRKSRIADDKIKAEGEDYIDAGYDENMKEIFHLLFS